MRVGIIGAGRMGGALGKAWAAAGHEVMFSFSRNATRLETLAADAGQGATVGTPEEAAAFGEVVVLVVPWGAREAAIAAMGPLTGKVLLTGVNSLNADMSELEVGHTTSAAEEIAKLAPAARVVGGLTGLFAENLEAGVLTFEGKRPSSFYASDDDEAKERVRLLLDDLGADPIDAGPLRSARYFEPLGFLVTRLAYFGGHGPRIAPRVLGISRG